MSHSELANIIDDAFERRNDVSPATKGPVRDAVDQALYLLDGGVVRVAEKQADGSWHVNQWLKKAVLLSFRLHDMEVIPFCAGPDARAWGWDKVPLKYDRWRREQFGQAQFRAVPGAIVRRSAYIAPNVVLMPSFVNLGAYVDSGTMVDTWATVGSCAQIGRNCHISGGAGIGGVLEPLQAGPVIIEDDCFVGARSEVAEGVVVRRGLGALHGRLHRRLDPDRRPRHRRGVPGRSAGLFGGGAGHPCPASRSRTARRGRASTAPSSSSVSTRRRGPRPASTNCCGIDGRDMSADPVALARDLLRCPSVTPAEGGALAFSKPCWRAPALRSTASRSRKPAPTTSKTSMPVSAPAAPHLVFAGHTDVVPPGDEAHWRHRPVRRRHRRWHAATAAAPST